MFGPWIYPWTLRLYQVFVYNELIHLLYITYIYHPRWTRDMFSENTWTWWFMPAERGRICLIIGLLQNMNNAFRKNESIMFWEHESMRLKRNISVLRWNVTTKMCGNQEKTNLWNLFISLYLTSLSRKAWPVIYRLYSCDISFQWRPAHWYIRLKVT